MFLNSLNSTLIGFPFLSTSLNDPLSSSPLSCICFLRQQQNIVNHKINQMRLFIALFFLCFSVIASKTPTQSPNCGMSCQPTTPSIQLPTSSPSIHPSHSPSLSPSLSHITKIPSTNGVEELKMAIYLHCFILFFLLV